MEATELNKEQLMEAAIAGTLTPEQEVEFYVVVLELPRSVAIERVRTDWDAYRRSKATGEGPVR